MELLNQLLSSFKNKLRNWLFPKEEEIWIIKNFKFVKIKLKNLFKEL